jgi:hypothetical protein
MAATNYSDIFPDPAAKTVDFVKSSRKHGRVRHAMAKFSLAAAACDAGAKFYIASIPSNAVLKYSSSAYFGAFTTAADWDVGDADTANALSDALDFTSAGISTILADVATADLGKELWELLGLAADPGGDIDLIATCNTASTHSGSLALVFEIDYVVT